MRVLIVDKSFGFFREAAEFVRSLPGVERVDWARTADGARQMVTENGADVVLVDFGLDDTSGVDLARELAHLGRAPRVILMSLFGGDEYERAALEVGATLVAKRAFVERLRDAIGPSRAEPCR